MNGKEKLKNFFKDVFKLEMGEEFTNEFFKNQKYNLEDLEFDFYYHRNHYYYAQNDEERKYHYNKMIEIDEIIRNLK